MEPGVEELPGSREICVPRKGFGVRKNLLPTLQEVAGLRVGIVDWSLQLTTEQWPFKVNFGFRSPNTQFSR